MVILANIVDCLFSHVWTLFDCKGRVRQVLPEAGDTDWNTSCF